MFGADDAAGDDTNTDTADKSEDTADVGEQGEDSNADAATDKTEVGDGDGDENKDGEAADAADPLDSELESLFKQLEDEAASNNPEQNVMDDIINELRMKSAEDATQIAYLTKQNESLQNRLLESASKETDQVMNQPLISKIEADPKLRAIIHLS